MGPGFLEGLISSAAEHISTERERQRAEEDRVLEQRRGALDFLLRGMQEGRVNPAYFAQVFKDMEAAAQPSSARKPKKGKAGFMGATEIDGSIFDEILSGAIPFMSEPAPAQAGGAAPPQANAEAPAPQPSAVPSGEIGTPLEAPAPLPPPPRPGTAQMTKAAGALAQDVQRTGPQAPPQRPGLFYSPEEIAERNARGKASVASAEMDAEFSTLVRLLGPDRAAAVFAASKGYNPASALRADDEFVHPNLNGTAKAARNPQTGVYQLTQPVQMMNGQVIAAGTPLDANWQPFQRPIVGTDASGRMTGLDPATGQPMWQGNYGRPTPDVATYLPIPDPNSPSGFTYGAGSRFGGRGITPTNTPAPPRTDLTSIDIDAADAQQRLEIINKIVGDDLNAIADMNGAKDRIAREYWGVSFAKVVQEAGRAVRRPQTPTRRPEEFRARTGFEEPGGLGAMADPNAALNHWLTTPEGRTALQQSGGNAEILKNRIRQAPDTLKQIMDWYVDSSKRR